MPQMRTAALVIGAVLASAAPAAAQAPSGVHPVTTRETVLLRTFEPGLLQLSPDGKQVAYVLREPDLSKSVNHMVLYVTPVPRGAPPPAAHRRRGHEVFRTTGDSFNQLKFQWTSDSRNLLVLHQPVGTSRRVISRVDRITGRSAVAYQSDLDVSSFAATPRGDRLAVLGSVKVRGTSGRLNSKRGVVIRPADHLSWMDSQDTLESEVVEVRVAEPGGASVTLFRTPSNSYPEAPLYLTIAPDGRHVAFAVTKADGIEVPASWRGDALFQYFLPLLLMALPARLTEASATPARPGSPILWPYRIAYDAPRVGRQMSWSDDGRTLVLEAPRPVGEGTAVSADPKARDREADRDRQGFYAIDVANGKATLVQQSAWGRDSTKTRDGLVESIVRFDQRGKRIILKQGNGEIVTLRRPSGTSGRDGWPEERRLKTDVAGFRKVQAATVGNDEVLVGVNQDLMVPPDLYVLELASGRKTILTEINPELKSQKLGRVEKMEWAGSDGTKYDGYIVYPVDYVPGTRYPCAILNKSWDDSFIHGGQAYPSNFPPQALAASGILVFMLAGGNADGQWGTPEGSDAYRAFGGARDRLAKRGLIDPNRVGIMGFSFTSFAVDFLLTHPGPGPQWAAAVSADGALYNYAVHATATPTDTRAPEGYGVRPFGKGLATYLKMAPAFNAQYVRTPLLQQYHGGTLRGAAEFHNALYAQGKPVELMWFPGGVHNLQLPSEREASMEQVVDWFRFWLQRYERPSVPDDPERYVRWRELREQHQVNERHIAEGKDPAAEFEKTLTAKP
jgi:dipeptidyl aminopeptidase/acylaminoacyl peptidase